MEVPFLSDKPYLFITLSVLLHIALYGAVAVYSTENSMSEIRLDGEKSAVNRIISVSTIFREADNPEPVINEKIAEPVLEKVAGENETAESSVSDESPVNNILSDSSAERKELSIDQFTTDLSPVYPAFARRNSYQGVVRASLIINSLGKGENVRIIKSSGFTILDKAAVKAIRKASFILKDEKSRDIFEKGSIPLVIDIDFSLTQE